MSRSPNMRRRYGRWSAVLAVLVSSLVGAPAADAAPATTYTYSLPAPIAVGEDPDAVAVDPSTHLAYVTNAPYRGGNDKVYVINEAKGSVERTIGVGQRAMGIAIDPQRHAAYVANRDSGTVSVIDTRNGGRLARTIACGGSPGGVGIDSARGIVYITDYFHSTVSVIDEASGTVTATIDLGGKPAAVAIDPGTHMAYVGEEMSQYGVEVIDDTTGTVVGGIDPGGAVDAVAIDPGTHSVWAADYKHTFAVRIDETTNTVTQMIRVGRTPAGVAVDPITRTVYVPNYRDDPGVTVIDEISGSVTATLSLAGEYPVGVAVDPGTHTAYVGNGLDAVRPIVQNPVPRKASVTGVSPASGTTAGGQTVTITGSGFVEATGVIFAGVPGTNVTIDSDTTLTVTTPAHTPAIVRVRVRTSEGLSAITTPARYTYQ